MYGDTAAIRRRVVQLREQGLEIRTMADRLVARAESVPWRRRGDAHPCPARRRGPRRRGRVVLGLAVARHLHRGGGDIRAATTGRRGLLTRSVELDADALVVRATVLTYRWIDELREAACRTLGSIAGRAIDYLAPEVALGGAIVSAGLIETDALDRDGVAAYLSDLAENNPELMDHISGGGGLLDGLQMRSLLTAGVLRGASGSLAARGGMRATGVQPFGYDGGSALRDAAGSLLADDLGAEARAAAYDGDKPRTITDLMTTLSTADAGIVVQGVGAGRYIAYLPCPGGAGGKRLRLVSGDHSGYARQVVRAIERAVGDDEGARVMLVGSAQGGATAAELAAAATSERFVIDHVVTAGAPSAQVPVVPVTCRVLSLEDRRPGGPARLLPTSTSSSRPRSSASARAATSPAEPAVGLCANTASGPVDRGPGARHRRTHCAEMASGPRAGASGAGRGLAEAAGFEPARGGNPQPA